MQIVSNAATSADLTDSSTAQLQVCHSSHNLLSSPWVERWLNTAVRRCQENQSNAIKTTPSFTVLDWACGAGRHAVLAARLGCQVWAADQDISALQLTIREQGVSVHAVEADLESKDDLAAQELFKSAAARAGFDVIVVSNYLYRSRLALLMTLLAPGGMLVYETFALGNEAFGRPSRAEFLLAPHELLDRARSAGLVVEGFEQGYAELPKPAVTQRIAASRPR